MRCDAISMQLKAYLDGEASGLAALRIRHHMRHCSQCAAQLAQWRQLNTLLLSHDLLTAPALPIAAMQPMSKGRTRMSLKLLIGVTATVAVFALTVMPNHGHHTMSMSMASEIRQAVSQVNTWHLKGWKVQGNSKIPWEVWGRRMPFFYREQVGPDVTVDDGKLRVSVFAPMPPSNQGTLAGIVLKTASLPDSGNVRWSYQRMVAQWNDNLRPESQTADDLIFNFPESGMFSGGDLGASTDLLYTVDRQSRLPVRYETRLGKPNAKRTISLLNADYNAPIPTDLALVSALPKGWKFYDATQSPPPQENAVTHNGITVQATPLAVSSEGLILLRIKTWMGGAMLDRNGPLTIDANAQSWATEETGTTPTIHDDQQRAYTQVYWDAIQDGRLDHDGALLLLTPADPLAPNVPLPGELTLTLDVTAQMDSRLSGTMGMGDQQLSRQSLTLTLPLPAPSGDGAQILSGYIDPKWKQRVLNFAGYENLTAATNLARARFYGGNMNWRNPNRPNLQKAAIYHERFSATSSCPDSAAWEHYWTAQIYAILGDKAHARRLLHAYLTDKRPEAQMKIITDPMLAKLDAASRKRAQEEARHIRELNRKGAQEALDTWAR